MTAQHKLNAIQCNACVPWTRSHNVSLPEGITAIEIRGKSMEHTPPFNSLQSIS